MTPPPDPAFAELQREMASADRPMITALAERDAQEQGAEADRQFGAQIRLVIAGKHGDAVAEAVRTAFISATRPATPARAKQDRIFRVLTARLDQIAGEAP